MDRWSFSPGKEALKEEIREQCKKMYHAICVLLYAMDGNRPSRSAEIQDCFVVRREVHDYIIEQSKQCQDISSRVMALGGGDQGISSSDRSLLAEYYEILSDLYNLFHANYGESLNGSGVVRMWQDTLGDQRPTKERVEVYSPSHSRYTFRRQILHQGILDNQSRLAQSVDGDYTPCAVILVGGFSPAAYQLGSALQDKGGDFVQIDPEQVGIQIPECQKALHYKDLGNREFEAARNAQQVCADEVEDLLATLWQRSLDRRYNLIVSGMGSDPGLIGELVSYLRKKKYKSYLVIVDQPKEVSLRRMARHGVRCGLAMDEESLLDAHEKLEHDIPVLMEKIPSVMVYENGGDQPNLVWVKEGKKSKVLQKEYLEKRGWNVK